MDFEKEVYNPQTYKQDRPPLRQKRECLLKTLTFSYMLKVRNIKHSSDGSIDYKDLYRTPEYMLYDKVMEDFYAFWERRGGKSKALFSTTILLYVKHNT